MIAPTRQPGQAEFVAMTAMMFATIAFSIDAMLPALPAIAQDLTPEAVNRAPLIITSFMLGMGLGTLIAGPMSDSFGRRRMILLGGAFYIAGAVLAGLSQSLELVLAARVLQGLGAAGPRVVSLAVVRDLYSGRDMARMISLVMMIFTLLPAIAPSLGAAIMAFTGWRGIFGAFVMFSLVSIGWFTLRQPETLRPENRRALEPGLLWQAAREVFTHRRVVIAIVVQTLIFSTLFMVLSSTQQIFDQYFGKGDSFPIWFGLIAVLAGTASVANARLVGRLGMRFLVRVTLGVQLIISSAMLASFGLGLFPTWAAFPAYVAWSVTLFGMMGLTIGNLNALAMQPLGHIAGMAASVIGATSTILAVILAAPVGLAFDGTPVPLAIGAVLAIGSARLLFVMMPDED